MLKELEPTLEVLYMSIIDLPTYDSSMLLAQVVLEVNEQSQER